MYMKDLNHKMTLRLNDELFEYVNENSDKFGISPSDFIRQCVALHKDSKDTAMKILESMGEKSKELIKEGFENGTDRKTDKHDLV